MSETRLSFACARKAMNARNASSLVTFCSGDSEVVLVSVCHQVSLLGFGVREEAQRDGSSLLGPT